MLKHYIYLLLVMASAGLWAQGKGQANIFIDSTSFLIGDQVSMQLVVNVPKGFKPTFPTIGALFEKEGLELIHQQEIEVVKGDVNDTYKQGLTLTAWEPGSVQVPSLTFSYKKNGALYEIQSAALMLTVTAPQVTGDSTYVADIKTILAEEANLFDRFYALLKHPVVVALLILALAFLGFLAYTELRKKQQLVQPPTAEEVALEQLKQLQEKDYLTQKRYRDFHTQISRILRTYLNNRFELQALEQPTSNFMPSLEGHHLLKGSLYEEFQIVLSHADLIKYAKASPLDVANKKALDFCYELLDSVQHILTEEAKQLEA